MSFVTAITVLTLSKETMRLEGLIGFANFNDTPRDISELRESRR
jgi:hypothetical protein